MKMKKPFEAEAVIVEPQGKLVVMTSRLAMPVELRRAT